MVRGGSPSQGWKTFFRNHAQVIAAIDLFVVPTLTFERLFAFLVLGHGRRQLLWFEVPRHPTAEWLARQITEDVPWASAPAYLVRDNDRAYGNAFRSRVRAMGIRDRPISPGSPWQNPYVERLIGTVRRECLDRVNGTTNACNHVCLATIIWGFWVSSIADRFGLDVGARFIERDNAELSAHSLSLWLRDNATARWARPYRNYVMPLDSVYMLL